MYIVLSTEKRFGFPILEATFGTLDFANEFVYSQLRTEIYENHEWHTDDFYVREEELDTVGRYQKNIYFPALKGSNDLIVSIIEA